MTLRDAVGYGEIDTLRNTIVRYTFIFLLQLEFGILDLWGRWFFHNEGRWGAWGNFRNTLEDWSMHRIQRIAYFLESSKKVFSLDLPCPLWGNNSRSRGESIFNSSAAIRILKKSYFLQAWWHRPWISPLQRQR